MKTRYEVQTFTLCDGWINTWSVSEQAGDDTFTEIPETFPTCAEAQAALDEFLAEIQEEIASGQRAPDEGYDPEEFRIVPVTAHNGGAS
jgi:hypothetical protein